MGNHVSHRPTTASGKVLLSDGSLHEYDKPLTVAELMLEHPQQVVVEFPSITTSKRLSPLPADKLLEHNKLYLMVPIKRGKPVAMSSAQLQQVLTRANSVLKSSSFLYSFEGLVPLFAKICPAGKNGIVVTRREKMEEGLEEKWKKEIFGDVLLERDDGYLSRSLSGKSWKPSLDTIKEKGVKEKIRHWLI